MSTKVFPFEPEDFSPKVEISAIYVIFKGHLLLLQLNLDDEEPEKWGVPAGKIDPNETPLQGAYRELFEETGIKCQTLETLQKLYVRKPWIDYIYHAFQLVLEDEPKIQLSKEHQDFKWVTYNEARKLQLMDGGKETLNFYFQKDKWN